MSAPAYKSSRLRDTIALGLIVSSITYAIATGVNWPLFAILALLFLASILL